MPHLELGPDPRVLTVHQPHARNLVAGVKRVENRTRPTRHRGPVLVHAGLGGDGPVLALSNPVRFPVGVVLGLVELTGCHRAQTLAHDGVKCCDHPGADPLAPWHWTCRPLHALERPVPARGQLGLWTAPADVVAAVQAQLRALRHLRPVAAG